MAEDPLIAKALERMSELHQEMVQLKLFINQADKLSGRESRYADLDAPIATPAAVGGSSRSVATKRWQPGDFFNKPFATAVQMILAERRAGEGQFTPASVDEIHEALAQGSFGFSANAIDAQKNSIRISLGKNSTRFVRLPNSDLFGLAEWYGPRASKTRIRRMAENLVAESVGAELANQGEAEEIVETNEFSGE